MRVAVHRGRALCTEFASFPPLLQALRPNRSRNRSQVGKVVRLERVDRRAPPWAVLPAFAEDSKIASSGYCRPESTKIDGFHRRHATQYRCPDSGCSEWYGHSSARRAARQVPVSIRGFRNSKSAAGDITAPSPPVLSSVFTETQLLPSHLSLQTQSTVPASAQQPPRAALAPLFGGGSLCPKQAGQHLLAVVFRNLRRYAMFPRKAPFGKFQLRVWVTCCRSLL